MHHCSLSVFEKSVDGLVWVGTIMMMGTMMRIAFRLPHAIYPLTHTQKKKRDKYMRKWSRSV